MTVPYDPRAEWAREDAAGVLPDSAKFCCGGLRALRQIGRALYGVFEFEADGFTPSDRRHVCRPVQAPPPNDEQVE